MDPTLNWKKAEVTEINENYVVLKLEKNLNAKIYKSNLNWAIKNKTIEDVFEIGDIMFTGTPEGVGKVIENDLLVGYIDERKVFSVRVK